MEGASQKKFRESLYKNPEGRYETEEERRTRERAGLDAESGTEDSLADMPDEKSEADQKEELQNPDRRRFVKGLAVLGGAAVFGATERHPSHPQDEVERNAEGEPIFFTPDVQLSRYREVKDIHFGLQSVFSREYDRILREPKGQKDMEESVENLDKLDIQRFVQPFLDRGVPYKLAYMIAIQETRAKHDTSWAGAKGITGIMPSTAEHYGYTTEDLKDPYVAAEISARYLVDERHRFGNNVDMLLHAYNGGGGLFGFTASYSFKDRTPEHFYAYMQEKINTEAAEKLRTGYHVHTFDTRTKNLSEVSELFSVALEELQEANPDVEPTTMKYGDEIKIPLAHAGAETWREVFRKYFETLYYTFEIHGKYAALKEQGLVSRIEKSLDTRLASAE